jgi:mannose-6-phosphate isomerase-like protein (cupin superfamily)
VAPDDRHDSAGVVDLMRGAGVGPLWGMASTDLNATLLAWPPGHEIAEHVNAELDVLIIVLSGQGIVAVDGRRHELTAGSALLVACGTSRCIEAGPGGLRYLSVHRRRGPLQIHGLHAD